VTGEGRKDFFFEKKKQKTFPGRFARGGDGGALTSAPQASRRWNACGAEIITRWSRFVRSTREKFFGSFFQKRFSL
jgi:hypothetical protein